MKRVLITGANSYVGTNVEAWLMKEPENFYVETLDMKDPNWKEFDFSKFDVVFHVAGIAHKKESEKNKDLYFKINEELAIDTAVFAKKNNIKYFIFMSSMSVYGLVSGGINENTIVDPKSFYGLSKYKAEIKIIGMASRDFQVAIIRPPMIYGPNSKGNYSSFRKFVAKSIIFPKIDNLRSFIYIDNFSFFLKNLIKNPKVGIYHPHNSDNSSTSNLAKNIADFHNHKVYFSKTFGKVLTLLPIKTARKLTTNLYYDFPKDKVSYVDFRRSIFITEAEWNEK